MPTSRTEHPTQVKCLLIGLWYSAGLNKSNTIKLPTNQFVEEQRECFYKLAESLLGDAAPSLEIET